MVDIAASRYFLYKNSFKHVVELAENEDMQKRWKYFLKNISKMGAHEFNKNFNLQF